MDQELLNEIQNFYDRLKKKSVQIGHVLFDSVFEGKVGWYNGHYHKSAHGTWVREAYPIPVIEVNGFCDIEIQPRQVSVSTKLSRSTALSYSFEKFTAYHFEAYGVEDYLADFYHPGQTIEDLKDKIRGCHEEEIGFSFVFPFHVEGQQMLEFVKLLRQEGFYY